jgi:hypothetical protein
MNQQKIKKFCTCAQLLKLFPYMALWISKLAAPSGLGGCDPLTARRGLFRPQYERK